jgi:hypothetical protein
VDHDHQGSEDVHSNGHKPLFSLGAFIFDGKGERIIKDSITFRKRYAMLLDVCSILLGVKSEVMKSVYAQYAYT